MSETIGFIGLGNMGVPMAGRLMDGGYSLVVNDLRRDAARPLLARGATWAASPAEVAAAAQIVITILPTSREVREVLLGAKGLLDALRPGSLVLEMTSADPSVTRELEREVVARGSALIDAPVSGGVRGRSRARSPSWSAAIPHSLSARARCWPAWARTSSTRARSARATRSSW